MKQAQNLNKQLVISPPMKYETNNHLHLQLPYYDKIKDTLQPNTTIVSTLAKASPTIMKETINQFKYVFQRELY
jgi:hypothetical protein